MTRAYIGVLAALLCGVGAKAAEDGASPARHVHRETARYTAVASLDPEVEGIDFYTPLTQGADGLMYGVSNGGGAGNSGAVFRVEADGRLTVVHAFSGSDGNYSLSPLTLGIDGWLYGTTSFGGPVNDGVIFKVSTTGEFVLLHSFSRHADQGLVNPQAQLVSDGQGGFYTLGHLAADWIRGVIFHYSAAGEITLLAQFKGRRHGRDPNSLIMGGDGVLYGTTAFGSGGHGGNVAGDFFSYTPGKGLKTLHAFDARMEGDGPASSIVMGPDGAFYGTLRTGGPCNCGAVYRITTRGAFSLIHPFTGTDPLGTSPDGGLAIDASGMLYGTTGANGKFVGGTVFSMNPKGEGKVIQALGAARSQKGYLPFAAPTWLPDGTLWGIDSEGGEIGRGTVFRIDLAR